MNYESPRKIFRDMYKNPDRYLSGPEEKGLIKDELEHDNKIQKKTKKQKEDVAQDVNSEHKAEVFTTHGKAFKQVVDNIFEADLIEGVDNPEELKIIKQRQEVVLSYLSKILEDVKNYLTQVSILESEKKSSFDDIKKYQAIVGRSDAMRKSYHDKLISDIKIAMRLININFNADFSEDLRLKEESKMPDRKEVSTDNLRDIMSQRKYFKFPFPVGTFIDFSKFPKDPQGEREYIARWALQLYTDLSVLNDEMRKALSELK